MFATSTMTSLTFNRCFTFFVGNFFVFLINGFNLDVDAPVFKIGPPNSYFGYAVAGHFMNDKSKPVLIIGAPRGESDQPGTKRAGAVYSCPMNRYLENPLSSPDFNKRWCEIINVEYDSENLDRYNKPPDDKTYYGAVNFTAKQDQLLGSVITAGGTPKSNVMVCAPNLVFDDQANIDGQCYLLKNDLSQFKLIHTCATWPKSKRHNEWGYCQEGFSASMREDFDVVVTGLPGAKRWVGGANVQEMNAINSIQRFTTLAKGEHAVEDKLNAHSYLGFSVGIGVFGFSHEEKSDHGNFTIVAGATRYNETGAVFMLPFSKSRKVTDLELLLTGDNFKLTGGDDFASSFGYSLLVTDIDSNGFDDLAVGAPHYFDASHSSPNGGAVFVYFSSGKKQDATSNNAVFEKPYKLLGPKFSQFGTSIAGVDLNKDKFNDIVVGAPFDQKGGAVYVYLGSSYANFDVKPSQIIYGQELHYYPLPFNLTTFGWSLFGGSDLDNNNYPDLVVGAFNSATVVVLRTKPVLNFVTNIDESRLRLVDKDIPQRCRLQIAKACFQVTTLLSIAQSDENIDLGRSFICRLEVSAATRPGLTFRAQFQDGRPYSEWDCRPSRSEQRKDHELYILEANRDWLNPIGMKFSIRLKDFTPPSPRERGDLINLNDYPVIAKKGSEKTFNIEFDNKCGPDRICEADLHLECKFEGLKRNENGVYLKDVGHGESQTINITYKIANYRERAYETLLYVQYDDTVFEFPEIVNKDTDITQEKREEGLIEYFIANPMLDKQSVSFTLSFSLLREKSGLKTSLEPLNFDTFVNTTSIDLDSFNNNCSMDVRVVLSAELDLQGSTSPEGQLLYGGHVMGASAMKFFEDVGNEVQHIYNLKNNGPSSVPEVKIIVEFPYEINSSFRDGKYALYITDMPEIRVQYKAYVNISQCSIDIENFKLTPINPFQLSDLNELNTNFSELGIDRRKRSPLEENETVKLQDLAKSQNDRKPVVGRLARELRRIKPIINEDGEKIVNISCKGPVERRTAKCVTITCIASDLPNEATATVTVVSRLWNSTFIEDYRDVNKVEIVSTAYIDYGKRLGLLDKNLENNKAEAVTSANPDLPAISEKTEIPIWIIILAVCGGVFLLLCIIILLWKCGFFNRRRHADQPLYKAEYKHNEEYDS